MKNANFRSIYGEEHDKKMRAPYLKFSRKTDKKQQNLPIRSDKFIKNKSLIKIDQCANYIIKSQIYTPMVKNRGSIQNIDHRYREYCYRYASCERNFFEQK